MAIGRWWGTRSSAALAALVLVGTAGWSAPAAVGREGDPPGLQPDGRSVLYPEDWVPGRPDDQGRLLPDFSYAGYRRGEEPVPSPQGPVFDPVDHGADPSGEEDSTAAIQAAIDAAAGAGGGVVELPPGEFRVRPTDGNSYALLIASSNIVLRGAGEDETRLFNDEPDMRQAAVIRVTPDPGPPSYDEEGRQKWMVRWRDWVDESGVERIVESGHVAVVADIPMEARTVTVADTSSFHVGEWIVVGHENTSEWRAQFDMSEVWDPDWDDGLDRWSLLDPPPAYYRQVTAIDHAASTIEVDIPIRADILVRDQPRVWRVLDHLEGVGVEHLAIGMVENDPENERDRTGSLTWLEEGTSGYELHGASAIMLNHVVHSWVRDVSSYRPDANTLDVHLASIGVRLVNSRSVTVQDVEMNNPLYLEGGGNGMGFRLYGASDNLLVDTRADNGRRGYELNNAQTTGNVILRGASAGSDLSNETHRQLSVANLFDGVTLDEGDSLRMVRRPGAHGQTTSRTVAWNTHAVDCDGPMISTQQVGWGYVIGTSGDCPEAVEVLPPPVEGDPVDHVEGLGQGDELTPGSLYLDQLERRLREPEPEPEPEPAPGGPSPEFGFFLTNGWAGGEADHAFMYGRPSDEVLIGDWDGDSRDTIMVRRGSDFYVSNALRGGAAEAVFTYGRPGDTVLVGDWDGDGVDTLAVRRGAVYHVKNSLSGGNADHVLVYGRAGDEVLVGDWGRDGDTFAVRRGATYYVKTTLTGGPADVVLTYGRAGDATLVGDWDGDGGDTLSVRRGRTYYVNDSLRGGPADLVMTYGRPGDEAYVGDWDGDGVDTIGLRRLP